MRKTLLAIAAVTIVAFAVIKVMALPADHNFSTAYAGNGGSYTAAAGPAQACSTCHVPHNPIKANPLWARNDSAQTFTLYGTDGTKYMNNSTFVGSKSGMCMSCHDGVTAIGGTVKMAAGAAVLGTNLSNSHPVGVKYQGNGTNGYATTPTTGIVLESNGGSSYVACTSCHDAHSSNTKMVRLTANLCVGCHMK